MTALYPLYHIVSDASRRNLLRARGPGEVPGLPPGEAVRVGDWERPSEIDRIMRTRPGVVRGERSA